MLVFGLCSVFSFGVSAADDVTLYEARYSGGHYESRIGPEIKMSNIPDPFKGLNVPSSQRYPMVLSSTYHAPRVSGRSVLDSYDFLSLTDIGYTSLFRIEGDGNATQITPYTTFVGHNYVQWDMALRVDGQKNIFTTGSQAYINFVPTQSNVNMYLGVAYDYPTFKAGETYEFYCFVSGIPDGTKFGLSFPDGTVRYKAYSGSSGGYFSRSFKVLKDFTLGSGNPFVAIGLTPNVQYQLQGIGFRRVISTDGVEGAIRDQTDDINKNHREEMDKIDDITDFDQQEQSDLSGQLNNATDQIKDKLGILSFADKLLHDFVGLFDDESLKTGIVFPGFSMEVQGVKYEIWSDKVYDLADLNDQFGPLITVVHFATTVLVYGALIGYIQSVFGKLMGDR